MKRKSTGQTRRRGFAAMTPEQQRELARRGGEAPHRGPRGFAAMDPEKVRSLAHRGGVADHHGPRGFAALSADEKRELAHRGGVAEHRGPRGFAALEPGQRREIARRGGEAPHQRRRATKTVESPRNTRLEWDTALVPETEDQWTDAMSGGHGGDFGGGRRGRLSRVDDERATVEPGFEDAPRGNSRSRKQRPPAQARARDASKRGPPARRR